MIFTLITPAFASANTGNKPFKSAVPNESTMQAKMAIAEQVQLLKQQPKLTSRFRKDERATGCRSYHSPFRKSVALAKVK